MLFVFYIFIFILGTLVGSFLNCVIYRLEQEKSFIRGHSFCPQCKHTLAWCDLVPVVSFIILKGKCRYCGERISWQYPIVEISTGLIFLLIFNGSALLTTSSSLSLRAEGLSLPKGFQTIISLILLWIIISSLEVIFVYDLKHYIIPDKVLYPAIVAVFFYQLFGNCLPAEALAKAGSLKIENLNYPFNPLIAAIVAAGFFFIIWSVSRGSWMGFGDVKLAFLLGLLLGFPKILVGLFLAFILGSIIGLLLISLGKKTIKSQVPFGPFLIAGSLVALFWGQSIIGWYLSFLNF